MANALLAAQAWQGMEDHRLHWVSAIRRKVMKGLHLRRVLWWMLPVLGAALIFPSPCVDDDGVYVRFKLEKPASTNWFVQLRGYIHVDPWYITEVAWPSGANTNAAARVASGQFTDWFDVKEWAGKKFHGRM